MELSPEKCVSVELAASRTHDWGLFQDFFYPGRRSPPSGSTGPVYVVVEGDTVLTAIGEGSDDWSEWAGAPLDEVKERYKHREILAFDRAKVEGWVRESLSHPRFYEQVEAIRAAVEPAVESTSRHRGKGALQGVFRRHFLLETLLGGWARVLPSSYGVLVRIKGGRQESDTLLVVRKGTLAGVLEPDLSALGAEKARLFPEVVRHVADRAGVSIQGLVLSRGEWEEWCRSPNPWRLAARAVRAGRAKLAPFRWSVALFIGVRAFLGF